MKKLLQDVYWGRKYPMYMENEQLYLVRKNWKFKLIYDVFSKETNEFLGNCIVKEMVNKIQPKCKNSKNCTNCKCRNMKYVVEELTSRSPQLKKRLRDIQIMIYESF